MRSRILLYSVRVWLTSVLVGPIFFILVVDLTIWVQAQYSRRRSSLQQEIIPKLSEAAELYFYWICVAVPFFFLFWLGSFLAHRRNWPLRMQKIGLAGWMLVLIAVTATAVAVSFRQRVQATAVAVGIFYAPFLFGILVYRFPQPKADPVLDFATDEAGRI